MFSPVMLIPVLLILAGVVYSVLYMRNVKARLASDGPAQVFHDAWCVYFDELPAGETIVEVWQGEKYAGVLDGRELKTGERAGRLAATLGAAALGVRVEYFRPIVYVGLTSLGRLLVAEEHAEDGMRGSYHQVGVYHRPQALADLEAYGGRHAESAPTNKANPKAPYSFVELHGHDGEGPYALWSVEQSYAASGAPGRSLRTAFPRTA
jgi:hypothetical protein